MPISKYSLAEKVKIVEEYYTSGLTQREIAEKYGIVTRTLKEWIFQFQINKKDKIAIVRTQIMGVNKGLKFFLRELNVIYESLDQILSDPDCFLPDKMKEVKSHIENLNEEMPNLQNQISNLGITTPADNIQADYIEHDPLGKREKFDWDN